MNREVDESVSRFHQSLFETRPIIIETWEDYFNDPFRIQDDDGNDDHIISQEELKGNQMMNDMNR